MYTIDITHHLAKLSKLCFKDDELLRMHRDMADIIELMDKVKEVNLTEVFVLDECGYDTLRDDLSKESYTHSQILSNAKKVKNQAFTVPKIF